MEAKNLTRGSGFAISCNQTHGVISQIYECFIFGKLTGPGCKGSPHIGQSTTFFHSSFFSSYLLHVSC